MRSIAIFRGNFASRRRTIRISVNRAAVGAVSVAVSLMASSAVAGLSLDYDSPAGTWNEALPIGNGRLGAMAYGAPGLERIQLNEDTLWAGGPNSALEPRMKEEIPKIRARVLAGDSDGALTAFREKRLKTSKNGNSFAYQTIGSLCLKFPGHDFPSRYCRSLSLEDAVARTEYCVGGVTFTREVFASFADEVLVMRIKASRPGAITFTAFFESPWQRFGRSTDKAGTLTLAGNGSAMHGVGGCVRFCTRLKPTVKGGTMRSDNGVLFVEGADEAVLWCSAATSFRDWRDGSSVDECAKADRFLSNAEQIGCDAALRRHADAYAAQFNRCRLDLGADPCPGRTVPERLASFKKTRDPYLAALYFAFGRYLLISSSQPGTQPPTLQGIWNEWLAPPWNSSYTININLEMNYWPVDVANLSDLIEPLLKALEESAISGARTARDMYGARGWVMHHHMDIWRITVPVHGAGGLWPMGGAWLAAQLWDHWLFTHDRAFLARAYPVMKGAAEFFLDTLVENPATGNLAVVPGVSPENIPAPQRANRNLWTTGASSDAQILRDLFSAVLNAATVLGREREDAAVLKEIAEKRARLEPLRIGRWGQLQEWTEDMDDPEDHHRHVSHLYCAYPSAQVTPDEPGLFKAAQVSLNARGDVATGWGMGWRVALWARFLDGERAYRVLKEQLAPTYASLGGTYRGGTYPNLLDAHPPFQIDGNLGCTAGIAELLLQSHRKAASGETVIDVLPALPAAWAAEGRATGLKARGGFEISFEWKNGRVTRLLVDSRVGIPAIIRYNDREVKVPAEKGKTQWN